MSLLNKKCIPCDGKTRPLTQDQINIYMDQLSGWTVSDSRLYREFAFKDFKEAMIFVNKVALLAEVENHHPDISIHYNKVRMDLWTHAIGGLSENDFIVAAKIEELLK